MTKFVQLHILTAYPPSNLNRDDLGRPKTAVFGGANRLRVSSQALKRAWRQSDVFRAALDGSVGTRTRMLGSEVFDKMQESGAEEKDAKEWARAIGGVFAKVGADQVRAEQPVHITPGEWDAAMALAEEVAARGKGPEKEELAGLLSKDHVAIDVAAFGRMLADAPKYNVDAAIQVAHALSVHQAAVEDDYFTAVDDLNRGDEDRGAAHAGTAEFGAATFYIYACIDRDLLRENLGGDDKLAAKGLDALTRAMTTVSPSGKQNSYGSRAWASYVLAERGATQPRTLVAAFQEPVDDADQISAARDRLLQLREKFDKVYGTDGQTESYELDVNAGKGSLDDLGGFVAG